MVHKCTSLNFSQKKESDRKETGGGPPAVLTTVEDLVIDGIRDKPQLIGIPGGIDSGDCYACIMIFLIYFSLLHFLSNL